MSAHERDQADRFLAELTEGASEDAHTEQAQWAEDEDWAQGADSFESLFDADERAPYEAPEDPGCPSPGPIPSRCTGIDVPEVVQCFEHDRHDVLPRHRPTVVHVARCIIASQGTRTPITSLRLVGHADTSGRPGHNRRLGERRANAVKSAIEAELLRLGGGRAPSIAFTVQTRGERDPVTGAAALSRRVEIFPPFAFPPRCPRSFLVSPASPSVLAGQSVTLRARNDGPTRPGRVTYQWRTASSTVLLRGASRSPQVVSGPSVTVDAQRSGSPRGEVVEVTRQQAGCSPVTRRVRVVVNCRGHRLRRARVIATAMDPIIRPVPGNVFRDPGIPGSARGHLLRFGQDLSFGTGRTLPHGPSQGTTTSALDTKMRRLPGIFASGDPHGKARRLFNDFLRPQTRVRFWSNRGLDTAAAGHTNIDAFIHLALNAPNSARRSSNNRIHQALRAANWDINAATAPTGLGVPAFNLGRAELRTQDFNNGLAVMINSIQHVVIVAKEYHYDACRREYRIKLQYVFYDVFGLDDDDLREFGADGGLIDSAASQGITAWWQLQHQHNYAPLITRFSIERTFTAPAR